MKKFLITIFIFVFLLSGKQSSLQFSLLDYFDGEYYAYVESSDYGGTNLGNCYMTTCAGTQNKIGESMVVYDFEPANAIKLLQAKVIKTEYLSTNATVIYCYSDQISKHIKIDNQKSNLQIACYEDHVVIGWPVILGSF